MAVKAPFSMVLETKGFTRWTQEFVKDMDRRTAWQFLRKIAFDFISIVVKRTPVDTGQARAGWTPFLDSEGRGDVAAAVINSPAPPGGKGGSPTPEGITEGREDGSFKVNKLGSKKFVEIINSVGHIIPLEFGHSKQAPGGMFRIALRIIRLKLKKEGQKALEASIKKANIVARVNMKAKGKL